MWSGVTSVAAAQSTRPVLVDTGATRPVTVARKTSASFCTGAARLPAAAATPAAPPATQATAKQATQTARLRIEVRMPETYLKPAGLVDGHCAW